MEQTNSIAAAKALSQLQSIQLAQGFTSIQACQRACGSSEGFALHPIMLARRTTPANSFRSRQQSVYLEVCMPTRSATEGQMLLGLSRRVCVESCAKAPVPIPCHNADRCGTPPLKPGSVKQQPLRGKTCVTLLVHAVAGWFRPVVVSSFLIGECLLCFLPPIAPLRPFQPPLRFVTKRRGGHRFSL